MEYYIQSAIYIKDILFKIILHFNIILSHSLFYSPSSLPNKEEVNCRHNISRHNIGSARQHAPLAGPERALFPCGRTPAPVMFAWQPSILFAPSCYLRSLSVFLSFLISLESSFLKRFFFRINILFILCNRDVITFFLLLNKLYKNGNGNYFD